MARRVISRLSIQVGAESRGLRKDFGQVAARAKGLRTQVNRAGEQTQIFARAQQRAATAAGNMRRRISGVVATLGLMVAGAAAASLSIGGLVSSFDRIDQLAKNADKLGESTEKLAGFAFAAELTGNNARTALLSLQRMVRRVSDAGQEAGTAVKALKELGVTTDQLRSQSPVEQFSTLADAFARVGSAADKVRLGFALFDSEGVAMVNTLALGSRGLAELQAEAERLGIAISRDAAAQVEMANDSIKRLSTAAQGATTQLAVALAPAIISVSAALTDLVQRIAATDGATVQAVVRMAAFTAAFISTVAVFPLFVRGISAVITALRTLRTASILAQGTTLVGLASLAVALPAAALAAKAADKAFESLADGARDAAAEARRAAASAKAMGVDTTAAAGGIEDTARAAREASEEFRKWQQLGQRLTQSVRTPAERLRDSVNEARAALNRGVIGWETYRRVVAKAADELERGAKSARELKRQTPNVAAVSQGTTAGVEAVASGLAALRQLRDRREREADERRDKLLEALIDTTRDVEEAIRENPVQVRSVRI